MKSTMVSLLTIAFHLKLPSLSFLVFHIKVCVWCSVGPVVSENQRERGSKKMFFSHIKKKKLIYNKMGYFYTNKSYLGFSSYGAV